MKKLRIITESGSEYLIVKKGENFEIINSMIKYELVRVVCFEIGKPLELIVKRFCDDEEDCHLILKSTNVKIVSAVE